MHSITVFSVILIIQAYFVLSNSFYLPNVVKQVSTFQKNNGDYLKKQYIAREGAVMSRVLNIRGGEAISQSKLNAVSTSFENLIKVAADNPTSLFNTLLGALLATSFLWKFAAAKIDQKSTTINVNPDQNKPEGVKTLQWKFLVVFWLLRMADWLQGPYFYEVYSSKILNGVPVSLDLVSKLFLVGFATTGILGPFMGRFVDSVGRKAGSLLYTLLYSLGALSTRSNQLMTLLLGRLAGGLGTSLLFSAPEAWLVAEHQRNNFDGKYLGQTFGWAYAGDSIVAILAGQLASIAAGKFGPSGPFSVSVGFLVSAAVLMLLYWNENVASKASNTNTDDGSTSTNSSNSITDAIQLMLQDKRIMLVGAVQALFEGAMYIFVLQWPPAIKAAIQMIPSFQQASIPFGNIFSCFMASCLLGSTAFGAIQRQISTSNDKSLTTEKTTSRMLMLASAAMLVATTLGISNLSLLIPAFFLFEACVGFYFPAIGTLRSKYLPDSHRSVMMNLFGIPLNLIVVTVFLSIKKLGVQGALTIASTALILSSICMTMLNRMTTPIETSPKK